MSTTLAPLDELFLEHGAARTTTQALVQRVGRDRLRVAADTADGSIHADREDLARYLGLSEDEAARAEVSGHLEGRAYVGAVGSFQMLQAAHDRLTSLERVVARQVVVAMCGLPPLARELVCQARHLAQEACEDPGDPLGHPPTAGGEVA